MWKEHGLTPKTAFGSERAHGIFSPNGVRSRENNISLLRPRRSCPTDATNTRHVHQLITHVEYSVIVVSRVVRNIQNAKAVSFGQRINRTPFQIFAEYEPNMPRVASKGEYRDLDTKKSIVKSASSINTTASKAKVRTTL